MLASRERRNGRNSAQSFNSNNDKSSKSGLRVKHVDTDQMTNPSGLNVKHTFGSQPNLSSLQEEIALPVGGGLARKN